MNELENNDIDESVEYERDTQIDPEALDTEWLKQPALYAKYGTLEARASDEVKNAQGCLDVLEAELRKKIVGNPAEYTGVSKPNLDTVNAVIATDPEIQKARKNVQEAQYEQSIFKIAVKAMDMKKTALENLVKLLLGNYFSGPQAPRDISIEWEHELKKKASKKIAGRRINKKRTRRSR